MNHVSAFFNSKFYFDESEKKSFTNNLVRVGDFYFTHVRYLFNGQVVSFKDADLQIKVQHQKEFSGISNANKKSNLKIILSIICLLPATIIGAAFKGLGYLTQANREKHRLAAKHYVPLECTLGSPSRLLNLDEIKNRLSEIKENNTILNQPIKVLTIYAVKDTQIDEDLGFEKLNLQKIILVNAKIHGVNKNEIPFDCGLQESLGWESHSKMIENSSESYIFQYEMNSVEEAKSDTPPVKTFFPFERFKRVYRVVDKVLTPALGFSKIA